MEGLQDEYSEQSLSPCSSDLGDIFGEPQVPARVGHEYQAEISPLIAEGDRLQLIHVPWNAKLKVTDHKTFPLGLPIPLMWSNTEVDKVTGAVEYENSEESQVTSNNDCAVPKPVVILSGHEKAMPVQSDLHEAAGDSRMEFELAMTDQRQRGLCPLPGIFGQSWTDDECSSFLLGLYIFGKNLFTVKRFVESKEMGDILSFYYGKFYRSEEYCRWSDCRKLRSRRSIHGQKIFSGWRQQELLSRLFSHVSQDCQSMLLEVSRTFEEGKISFEEYVFTIKNAVGINVLIEAVSIGKGKQDLTGTATEPVKHKHAISIRHEIPIGKACSSLTSADIIKFLTGDFRLSKARSSDLFWEAVWPRLLARGWHSEQPKDHGISGSNNSLVFLVPGIKKFSRRRLAKGNHYFDSVSDVLHKVASDPRLLELEVVANGDQEKKESGWNQNLEQEQDGLSKKGRHFYLQPRSSSSNQGKHKFTIVDTSLAYGPEGSIVSELTSLPVHTSSTSTSSSLCSESEDDTFEDQDQQHMTSNAREVTAEGACADSSDSVKSLSNKGTSSSPNPSNSFVENNENQYISLDDDKLQRKAMKDQFSLKPKSGCSKYLVPLTKQQDFIARNHQELSCSTQNTFIPMKENGLQCTSNSPFEEMEFQIVAHHQFSYASSLAKGSQDENNDSIVGENCLDREVSPEKLLYHNMINLNIPQTSTELAADEPVILNTAPTNISSFADKQSSISETSQQPNQCHLPDSGADLEQRVNSRRQSRRNRPLTTKALEALELDLFSTKKKRKSSDAPESVLASRPFRRARGRAAVKEMTKDTDINDATSSQTGVVLDGPHTDAHMVE
ncbi:hypothetical protein Tsubulata_012458 [Turnera subulata]|uniref:SANT domain-containing protein n=1 Tax=Turnera subulata TaxID=218843 RepID=A0A9Q0J4X8_9ROSI|nr:hypothetical protein Tsubulata_012458 [Turnera subulata]